MERGPSCSRSPDACSQRLRYAFLHTPLGSFSRVRWAPARCARRFHRAWGRLSALRERLGELATDAGDAAAHQRAAAAPRIVEECGVI